MRGGALLVSAAAAIGLWAWARRRRRRRAAPRALRAGDVVAVLAPSSGAAAIFPHVRDQGVRRLEALLGATARVMPSCALAGAALTPAARAADLNAAFGDADVKAIVCAIGGDDAVRVLPLLDRALIAANPKPLLGFSDATALHLYLDRLGVPLLYGGALLCQFAISGPAMHEFTAAAFRHALLSPEAPLRLEPSRAFQDGYLEWGDEANLARAGALEPNPGWEWAGAPAGGGVARGRLWGGCLEPLLAHLALGRYTPPAAELAGAVLFVETSEEFPSAHSVYALFQTLGELGVLGRLAAVLVGRPQTVARGVAVAGGRDEYRAAQRAAVLRAVGEYSEGGAPTPVVFGLDFGHTDPQFLVPVGGTATIDFGRRTIEMSYT